jgi:hypothetical protein
MVTTVECGMNHLLPIVRLNPSTCLVGAEEHRAKPLLGQPMSGPKSEPHTSGI